MHVMVDADGGLMDTVLHKNETDVRHTGGKSLISWVGQNRIYTYIYTVYLVISKP